MKSKVSRLKPKVSRKPAAAVSPTSDVRLQTKDLPAVRCAFTRMVSLSDLKPNPRNPNEHPPAQLALYRKVIQHQGIRRPIVVSKRSGLIVTGHGLWEVLKAMGCATAPIDEQQFKSAADEHAHLLADNRLPELAELDDAQIAALETDIALAGLDLELTGKLSEEVFPTRLVDVATQAPPKMSWVLIGIPTPRFGEIAEQIEKFAALENIILETTSNDGAT